MREQGSRPTAKKLSAVGLAALLVLLEACSSSGGPSAPFSTATRSTGRPSSSSGSPKSISVSSTLDGHTALPHRIHWIARPRPDTDVAEVDFLIDGKQLWTEHNAPYFYGDDGNYLVTSFLTPGKHDFTVRVITIHGASADDLLTAKVSAAPVPPSALAGTWKGYRPAGGVPAGYWRLVIDNVGWEILEPPASGGGNRVDVAYLSPGLLEARTGMATGHEGFDLNGWCNGAPGSPARYRWSVNGANLSLAFVGGDACPGFTDFITGPWTRAS